MKVTSGLQIFAAVFLLSALNACSHGQPEKSVAYSRPANTYTANEFIGTARQAGQNMLPPSPNTNPDPNCMDKFTRPTGIGKPDHFNAHAFWENQVARCKAGT